MFCRHWGNNSDVVKLCYYHWYWQQNQMSVRLEDITLEIFWSVRVFAAASGQSKALIYSPFCYVQWLQLYFHRQLYCYWWSPEYTPLQSYNLLQMFSVYSLHTFFSILFNSCWDFIRTVCALLIILFSSMIFMETFSSCCVRAADDWNL